VPGASLAQAVPSKGKACLRNASYTVFTLRSIGPKCSSRWITSSNMSLYMRRVSFSKAPANCPCPSSRALADAAARQAPASAEDPAPRAGLSAARALADCEAAEAAKPVARSCRSGRAAASRGGAGDKERPNSQQPRLGGQGRAVPGAENGGRADGWPEEGGGGKAWPAAGGGGNARLGAAAPRQPPAAPLPLSRSAGPGGAGDLDECRAGCWRATEAWDAWPTDVLRAFRRPALEGTSDPGAPPRRERMRSRSRSAMPTSNCSASDVMRFIRLCFLRSAPVPTPTSGDCACGTAPSEAMAGAGTFCLGAACSRAPAPRALPGLPLHVAAAAPRPSPCRVLMEAERSFLMEAADTVLRNGDCMRPRAADEPKPRGVVSCGAPPWAPSRCSTGTLAFRERAGTTRSSDEGPLVPSAAVGACADGDLLALSPL